ncbi:uncharacterized protein sytl2a isoform 1-T1 [Polymixia lowei]
MINRSQPLIEVDGPSGRQTNAPRGILKHMSRSSSTDSLKSQLAPQSPVSPDSPTETSPARDQESLGWIDRKQVRFCSEAGSEEWQDGKEVGEHSLLDRDVITPTEEEQNTGLVNTSNTTAGIRRPLLKQREVDEDEGGLSCERGSKVQKQDAGPHQVPGDLCEKNHAELVSPQVSNVLPAEQESGKPFHLETGPEEDGHYQAKATDRHTEGLEDNIKQQPKLSQQVSHKRDVFVEAASDTKPSANGSSKNPSHAVSPKPRRGLLGIFSRSESKEKGTTLESPYKAEGKLSKQKNLDDDGNDASDDALKIHNSKSAASITEDHQINFASTKQEVKIPGTEVRTLQLTALQNTPFKETMASLDSGLDFEQEPTESKDRVIKFPITLTSLKTFWERGNSGPKILFTKDQKMDENTPETEIEDSHGSQNVQIDPVVESKHGNLPPETELIEHCETEDNAAQSNDKMSSPKIESSLLDLPKEDGTYRARPILICEETDDTLRGSITDSQILQPQENITAPLPIAPACSIPNPQGDSPVPLPGQSGPQENRSNKVSDLKCFWEKEHSGPNIIVGKVKETSSSPTHSCLSSGIATHFNESVLPQERPLSPSRSHSPRSKDSSDDELRKSPSKTCHPKALPRESSSPKGSRLEGSPLKTFPIDIAPLAKGTEEQSERPTPAARTRKSPSHEAKQSGLKDIKDSTETICGPLLLQPGDCEEHNLHLTWKTSQQKTQDSAQSLTQLTRGYDEDSSPLRSALKRISSRPMSSSKSLENFTSQITGEEKNPKGQQNLSVDDASALPPSASSLSDTEHMKKMSASVPVFQQEEMDSDSTSDNNMSWRRNTGSSTSNLSLSSGMASMSSVSGSVTSLYPADFGDVEVQGTIQFAVNYVQMLGEFHIFVVHCRDLAVADLKKNRSDPYVKCYLLPDKTKLGKRKTSVKKKTLNPTYNEILRFKVTMEVLKTQELNISVWHNDTFGRNSYLGEVDLHLSEWDFSNTQINDYTLKARVSVTQISVAPISPSAPSSPSMDRRGQMRVGLRFLPQISHSKKTSKMETGEVQIWVKGCKNLPPVRGVVIDPFVKCTVLPDTSRKSRQKTRVVKRTANPMFNHTMVYDGFRMEDLKEACVELTVWDHDRLNNHYIGGLRLGLGTGKSYGADVVWMDSTTKEANLWERMIQSNGEWVEDVLPLRMLVMAKSTSK